MKLVKIGGGIMNILNELIKETSKIDFKFPKSFDQLMNSKYYDYDKFEWFLYYVFKMDGSSVQKVGKKGQGDGGADLIVSSRTPDGEYRRIGIQAKYWKNKVGSGPINQLASAKNRHDLTDLWIVTTSDLTTDAKEIAETLDIKILRGADVKNLIEHVKSIYEKEIETNGQSSIEFLEEDIKPKFEKTKKVEVSDEDEKDLPIVKAFKELRTELAKKHKIYPLYMVYNNAMIDDVIKENPKTKEELLKIKGFGQQKVDLFGEDILKLLNSNQEKTNTISLDKEQELYEKLIVERIRIAKFNKLKESDVYTDQVAKNLSKMKPRTKEHLEKIYGFNKKNIDIFGEYLINFISKNV